MKIVIATPILYSSTSPFNHLFKDIIGGFLDDGNQIIRLVAVENKTDSEFKYGFENSNIQYKLYKRKSSDHGNVFSRFLRDTFTNIREAIVILKLKNVDILFEDVSYSSFWSVVAAKVKGIKVVAMLQDVWPDNAVQSRILSENSLIYKFFEIWQKPVYKYADKLICISDDMKDFIISKGVTSNKIDVIYNWGYSNDIVDIPWENNEFVKKYKLDRKKFYVIYAGNIGKMQNVEIIVNAAKKLQKQEDIQFLIIGDGVRRKEIENMAQGSENITLLPMQPSKFATHIYSAAGVNIIPLVAGGTKTAFPSKTGVIMSCGKPAIYTYGTESKFSKIIEKYKVGMIVDADDYNALAEKIIEMKNTENVDRKKIYQVFQHYFARKKNVKKYSDIIKMVK